MDTIVTFDIKRNHSEIKAGLIKLGYKDAVDGSEKCTSEPTTIKLPDTTLLKYGAISTDAVMDHVVSVIEKHDGGLDGIFCTKLTDPIKRSGQS
ncbi:hypothetical protein [Mucilaginibacter terrae]|uniref:Uncharacterized protein n=1 Tax=Mucilaginibacter terrae TaxID=1955052 RepID=A0ABU3GR54_9SPHI|nr:hypothetical protein [Mucilaginibacter terrae]MDT3402259.1 hypothetical protein [Mucilaginibacter terrae]